MKEQKDFRETLYTIDEEGNRHWVYSALAKGRFFYRRRIVAYTLMAIYLATPWLTVNGKQALFLDFPNRQFTVFGTTFIATDTLYLMLTLGMLGLCLFFFTSLVGRVWCGWACPETVFLEFLFRPIERLIEGSPQSRRRLDAASWSVSKALRKATKFGLFAVVAWILASTALAYLFGAQRMIEMMSHPPTENLPPFIATLFMMGVLLFQFGWFREQFCTILCPYARFQSVLLDPNSLVIGYDITRGEPRGKLKGSIAEQKGHCVDCAACVRACPTGIDIRNGLQLECVNCAACIDACDAVMENVGFPRRLIRYDTENRLLGRPSRIVRPRIIAYALLLTVFLGIFGTALHRRLPFEADFMRAPGVLPYALLPDGRLSNQLNVQLANKSDLAKTFHTQLASPLNASIELIMPGDPLTLAPRELRRVPIFINFPKDILKNGRTDIVLQVTSGELSSTQSFVLMGPD